MAKAYFGGVFPDEEYRRQKRLLELELESLVVPAANAAEEAGKLILNLEELWAEANVEERRRLLLSTLDAVYFDTKAAKSIVAVRPKPPFKPIFQVAACKQGSGIRIMNEPPSVGSSVFLVEAGEAPSFPETRYIGMWMDGRAEPNDGQDVCVQSSRSKPSKSKSNQLIRNMLLQPFADKFQHSGIQGSLHLFSII
jgi:hypothetical protein